MPFLAILPSSKCRRPQTQMHCSASGFASFLLYARLVPSPFRVFPVSSHLPHFEKLSTHRSFATPSSTSHSYQDANHTLFSSAMGKSRSATVIIAYLMQEHNISPSEALSHLRQARSICEPNEGFMKQLELYGEMQTPDDVEQTPAYQRWVYQREIELSRACGQAPEAEKIRFEDEHVTDPSSGFELRCRKCRCVVLLSWPWMSPGESCRCLSCSALTISQTATCNFAVSDSTQVICTRRRSERRDAASCIHAKLCSLLLRSPVLDASRARTGEAGRAA